MEYTIISVISVVIGAFISFFILNKLNDKNKSNQNIEHLFELQKKDWEKGQSDFKGIIEPLKENLKDLCASYQEAIIDTLFLRIKIAVEITQIKIVSISGGFAAK